MKKILLLSSLMLTAFADDCTNSCEEIRGCGNVSFANSRVVFPIPDSNVSPKNITIIGSIRDKENKAVKNTEVIVSIDGVVHGSAISDKFGNWTYKLRPNCKLSKGKHTVSAVEAKNHICLQESTFNVKAKSEEIRTCDVDTTTSCIAYPYQDAFVGTAEPHVVGFVCDSSYNPVANTQVVIKRGSTTLATVNSDENGVFCHQLTSGQALSPDGQYTFTARACTSPTVDLDPVTFTVDTTAPSAPVITGVSVSGNTATISGTTEGYGMISTYIDSSSEAQMTYADDSGNWSIEYFLTSGAHSVQATCTDLAFNEGPLCSAYNFSV